MAISGDELYDTILGHNLEAKVSLLTELKRHVKKDNVTLPFVPRYFESLSIAMDSNDLTLQSLAFSLICHLVKRVSIQASDGSLLLEQSFLILPILIPKLADSKHSVKVAAGRTLEAFWLSAAPKAEAGLIEFGLSNRSPLVINECVVWINHILTSINPYLKLDGFFDSLSIVLSKYESEKALIENIKTLFANYYELKHNGLRKYELQRVLETHNVNAALRRSIMGTDNIMRETENKPVSILSTMGVEPVPAKLAFESQIKARPQNLQQDHSPAQPSEDGKSSYQTLDLHDSSLDDLLKPLPNYKFDDTMASIDVYDQNQLYRTTAEMLPCFEGKESEKNWVLREKSILKLRSLLRGNAVQYYLEDMIITVKELADAINKGLLSLRTTLSVNSCQLVKEMAYVFGEAFDPLSELFFPTLLKLCSATKHLTTTNAHVTVCAILAKCSFQPRIAQRIITASSDKSVNTRSYSAFWPQILLLRFWDSEVSKNILDIFDKLLPKLLSDPSSQVRQAAKECYKKYYDIFPSKCSQLLKSLDPAAVRVLGRSMPELVGLNQFTALSTKRSRPSLKESIVMKNKELKAKQSDSRSSSRSLPRLVSDHISEGHSMSDHSKGLPSSSKHLKPASQYNANPTADLLPHYAQSTFSQRLSSNPIGKVSRIQTEISNDLMAKQKHLTQEIKALKRRDYDAVATFDKKSDPLVNFLSSTQDEFICEGVNLLRYAIIGDEDLSNEVISSVRRISLSSPHLLRLLFEDGDNLFAKTKSVFSAEDYLRLCTIILPMTDKNINSIVSAFEVDELYTTVTSLISYIADLDNIVDDKLLVMQIIKFKTRMLDLLVKILLHVSSHLPLSDINFAKLSSNLFDLVPIVHSTSSYSSYKDLLKKLYGINSVLFTSQLSVASKVSRSEIEQFVGIDQILRFNQHDRAPIMPVSELTEISPAALTLKMSPLKQPSDFTMLMPMKSSGPDGPILLKDVDIKVKLEFPSMELKYESKEKNLKHLFEEANSLRGEDREVIMRDTESLTGEGVEEMQIADADSLSPPIVEDEILNSDVTSVREWKYSPNDVFLKEAQGDSINSSSKSTTSASSSELVNDFAQVKLTNPNTSIQNIIEKIDPLKKISSKNKPIFIFEDSKTGSPEKVKDYSYLELNWFNFLISKLSLDDLFQASDDYGIDEFKFLCKQLNRSILTANQFSKLLGYIQKDQSAEFMQYFIGEGFELLQHSMWNSLSSDISESSMNCLILLKQMLIKKLPVNLDLMWSSLLQLAAKSGDPLNEIRVAIGEIFDEAICGSFSTAEITQTVLNTLRRLGGESEKSLAFSVECLYKILSSGTLTLKINRDLVSELCKVLNPLINHNETEVRKLAFQTYGRLMRTIAISGISNRVLSPEKSDNYLEDEMLSNLSGPQKKLVEYFSSISL